MIEVILSLVLLLLLLFFLNPLDFWMPNDMQMMLILVLLLVFALFVGFVFREKAHDEREALHRYIANRYAYLAGSGVLVMGIVWQSLHHTLDPWLVIALMVMIFAKVASHMLSRMKH